MLTAHSSLKHLAALAITFVVDVLFIFTANMLQIAGFIDWLPLQTIWLVMFLTWFAALLGRFDTRVLGWFTSDDGGYRTPHLPREPPARAVSLGIPVGQQDQSGKGREKPHKFAKVFVPLLTTTAGLEFCSRFLSRNHAVKIDSPFFDS